MKRTLVLRREALAELADDDLAGLAGAAAEYSGDGLTCPVLRCTRYLTIMYRCSTFPAC